MTRKHVPLFAALLCALLLVSLPAHAANYTSRRTRSVHISDFLERYIANSYYLSKVSDATAVFCMDYYPADAPEEYISNENGYMLYDPTSFEVTEVFVPLFSLSSVKTTEDKMIFTGIMSLSILEFDDREDTSEVFMPNDALLAAFDVINACSDKLQDDSFVSSVMSASPERFFIYSGNYDYYMEYFSSLYDGQHEPLSGQNGFAIRAVLRK